MGKICLVMYGVHTPEIDAKIIASAPVVDMFIANTNAGMWHTPVTPDKFQGIKVFSYGDGSYETRPLADNLAFVDAISKEGCYGFFLDQVSAYPDATALTYIKTIYDYCKSKGMKLMVNTGVSDWSDALMSVCDYVMSSELWYDSPPTPSQSKWLPRVIVVSNSVPTLSQAVERTKQAWARGYSWHYACADNIYNMSAYYSDYINALKGEVMANEVNVTLVFEPIDSGLWNITARAVNKTTQALLAGTVTLWLVQGLAILQEPPTSFIMKSFTNPYTFGNMPVGTYTIYGQCAGYKDASTTFTVG